MRILQVTSKFPYPAVDGGSIASLALAEGLSKAGASIDLFSLNTAKHSADDHQEEGLKKEGHYKLIRKCDIDTTPSIVRALKHKWSGVSNYYVDRFFSIECWEALSQLIRLNNYEIIILDHLNTTVYLNPISEQVDCPIVIRAHNVESELRQRISDGAGKFSSRWILKGEVDKLRTYEVEVLNAADLVLTVSDRDRYQLENLGVVSEMKTVPIGISAEPSTQAASSDVFKIGFIGSLDWKPNLLGLYWFVNKLWPTIYSQHREVELHIAGSYLKSRPQWFNKNSIHYHGKVDDSKEFTRSMNLMIVPLWTGSGTRVKIIEAMATKVPVLATVLGAEGLDVTSGQEAWITDKASEWIDQINAIIENREESHAVVQAAYNYVQSVHEPVEIGKQLFEEFEKLLP